MKPGIIPCGILLLLAAGGLAGPPLDAAALLRYTAIGFRHIVPEGPDHVLFVLGLFFLSRDALSLLWQVTAFTVAHSLTFGLMLCGFVELPAHAVDFAVALSIAFIAVENLISHKLTRWRPWMVFGFGLIHGLAFAHTFRGHTVPVDEFVPALFAFNMGIEFGQLVVVLLAFAAFGAFWQRPWYRKAVTIPASSLIAVASLFWMMTRIAG